MDHRSRLGLLVPVSATLLLGAFVLLYGFDRPLYLRALVAIHEHPFLPPFLDTRFVTAQVECWARGIDVYARNPCDPLGRTHDYSPLWLRLGVLAQPASATPALGLGTCLVFLLSLFLMPWRGHDWTGVLLGVLAVCSWTTLFAGERGNTDLLMFAVAVVASRSMESRSALRWGAGQALVLLAGLLKFFPLVLLLLAVRQTLRRVLVLGVCSILLVGAFAIGFHRELGRIGANMATGTFGHMWGARTLPFGLLTRRVTTGAGWGWRQPVSVLLLVLCCSVMLAAAIRVGRGVALRQALARFAPAERALLLAGAALCVGCFFAHQNIGYRAVLLILPLPGLNRLARAEPHANFRRVSWPVFWRGTAVLVVLVLWAGTLSRKPPVWLLLGIAWWWVVFALSAVLVAALWDVVPARLRLFRGALRRGSDASSLSRGT